MRNRKGIFISKGKKRAQEKRAIKTRKGVWRKKASQNWCQKATGNEREADYTQEP